MSGDTSLAEIGIRLIGSLALVVGLMLLIARSVGKRFKSSSGAVIQVVQRQAIGRGTGVAVVSVGTRVLVLGTTEQQVTLLAEVEPDEVGIDLADLEPSYDDGAGDGRFTTSATSGSRPVSASGPLAGSVLSLQTWKQTFAAFKPGSAAAVGSTADPVPEEREAS